MRDDKNEYTEDGLRIVEEDEVFDNFIKLEFELLLTAKHRAQCQATWKSGIQCNQPTSLASSKYCYYHEKVREGLIKIPE